ncbi:hypothetical protein PENCOP_c009G02191 [Penicillium coprophilum]|uniref:Uncharacterized protein n=1 Tax=Penicillium coprophilum TaxID=36646 RepID=A0A1V6UHD5_9EURO|nr:hypothetical protein PENCOP_c009G02191 [Penicillium coprophilum]
MAWKNLDMYVPRLAAMGLNSSTSNRDENGMMLVKYLRSEFEGFVLVLEVQATVE